MTRTNSAGDADESRRSFLKKGALASSAVALGLAGSGTATTGANRQGTVSTGLVFVDDYEPGDPFTVVTRMDQSTVRAVLGGQPEDPTIVDPSDYSGYIVSDRHGEDVPGGFWFVFTRGDALEPGQTYAFTEEVVFFSSNLYLVKAELRTVEREADEGAAEASGGETTDGEPAEEATERGGADDENQQEVVVNATETTATEGDDDENQQEVVVNATETTATESG